MTIQTLLSKGHLKEAIQIIIDSGSMDGLMLMARYNTALKDYQFGLVDSTEYQRTINRITHAIFHFADIEPTPVRRQRQQVKVKSNFDETTLLTIVRKNKRRRPEIATTATTILNDYRAWKDKKAISPSFDPVGRRLKLIRFKADELLKRLSHEQEVSLEKIIERIAQLLEPIIPSYTHLSDAYKLAAGRGFQSVWIEQQLKAQPNDEEVQITIAEKIEEFTLAIHVA